MVNSKGKHQRQIELLLKSWYGEKRGALEAEFYTPQAVNASDAMTDFLNRVLPAEMAELSLIQQNWPELVGPQLLKVSSVLAFEKGILIIEVNHPLWLREFSNLKPLLIPKINALLGKAACHDFRCIPAGRRSISSPKRRVF